LKTLFIVTMGCNRSRDKKGKARSGIEYRGRNKSRNEEIRADTKERHRYDQKQERRDGKKSKVEKFAMTREFFYKRVSKQLTKSVVL